MSFFDLFRRPDINRGVADCKALSGAVLLDVRTPLEYREGHIPGSRNLPLEQLGAAEKMIAAQDTPVFLYCHSGSRSGRAAGLLRRMGYTNVQNIGGIAAWNGQVEQ